MQRMGILKPLPDIKVFDDQADSLILDELRARAAGSHRGGGGWDTEERARGEREQVSECLQVRRRARGEGP